MCLSIKSPNQKPPLKPVTVYKWYVLDPERSLAKGYHSPYRLRHAKLQKGKYVRSDRVEEQLTEREKDNLSVYCGFHCYAFLRKAIEDAKEETSGGNTYRVARFIGQPKDFVARGVFAGRKSLVFTKLKFDGWATENITVKKYQWSY